MNRRKLEEYWAQFRAQQKKTQPELVKAMLDWTDDNTPIFSVPSIACYKAIMPILEDIRFKNPVVIQNYPDNETPNIANPIMGGYFNNKNGVSDARSDIGNVSRARIPRKIYHDNLSAQRIKWRYRSNSPRYILDENIAYALLEIERERMALLKKLEKELHSLKKEYQHYMMEG